MSINIQHLWMKYGKGEKTKMHIGLETTINQLEEPPCIKLLSTMSGRHIYQYSNLYRGAPTFLNAP